MFCRIIICLGLFISSLPCFASCVNSGGFSGNVSIDAITIQKDVPVGSDIYDTSIQNTGSVGFNCSGGIIYYSMDYSTTPVSGYNHVYETNVKGVGVEVSVSGADGHYFESPANQRSMGSSFVQYSGYSEVIKFIKTGDIESGVLNSGPFVSVKGDGSGTPLITISLTGNRTVNVLKCSLKTPKLAYSMGNIDVSSFKGAGTNPDVPLKEHQLSMDCDKDANVNITLSATQNPDSSDDSVIKLTGQGDAGVAQGVGVQLMYDSKPLEINKMINLKKSGGGIDVFNIGARYIQTKGTVTPGKANATAVLNVTYQ